MSSMYLQNDAPFDTRKKNDLQFKKITENHLFIKKLNLYWTFSTILKLCKFHICEFWRFLIFLFFYT